MATEYGKKNDTTPLAAASYEYLAELYEDFKSGKKDIPEQWQQYFSEDANTVDYDAIRDKFKKLAKQKTTIVQESGGGSAISLKSAYREFGHIVANTNPLYKNTNHFDLLDIKKHGFNSDSDQIQDKHHKTVKSLQAELHNSYCKQVSLETSHITNIEERQWLYEKVETVNAYEVSDIKDKHKILENLSRAEGIENYFALKYVGQKRFSLEGGDSLIPGIQLGLEYASIQYNVTDTVIGMAHRGRLNVMLNVLAMPAEEIFKEFEGRSNYGNTSGDVKYHLGYSSDISFEDNKSMHISLMFNPSHLEFIAPVVNGSVRARQDLLDKGCKHEVMPIIIHGDAAMAGQGVVAETLNMSKVDAFDVAGSLHIVINNQVGFTATSKDYMSSEYCTGVAKSINAPIFHVNGDDPEAVVKVIKLAIDYRMKFAKDIVVDLVCYRRLGHNEADEPSATLPMMYDLVKKHPTPRLIYSEKLVSANVITAAESKKMEDIVKENMDSGGVLIKGDKSSKTHMRRFQWEKFIDKHWDQAVETGININNLKSYADNISKVPEDFKLQRQVGLLLKQREQMSSGELALNWGMAEMLAYSSLLSLGFKVRIVGQDSKRGTFSHRHAVLYDQNSGREYSPLQNLTSNDDFFIYDSVLSETGPLGYEYGYSISNPNCLNIWEAQFGDFANGAQVIIDQFISSGWQKWKRLSGLVLLLPHGYEGMGPEHSSARLERFLQLAAQKNIQVCVPSTPSQMFHLLMRQMMREYRRPLIVMTPKSLLRHHDATSSLDDLKKGRFELVIPDDSKIKPSKVKRVILCCGKVYYDLKKAREENNLTDIGIIRIEQLYPFPAEMLTLILSRYSKVRDFVWCQEEPQNQGSWFVKKSSIERCLHPGATLVYAGREFSAAPAAGYPSLHKKQQQDLVKQALGL